MNYATALEPRSTPFSPPSEDWDRLPWLPEVRKPVRRRVSAAFLLSAVGLVIADAAASYGLGEYSVRQGWALPVVASPRLQTESLPPADTRILATRISQAERVGWELRRPNAPY